MTSETPNPKKGKAWNPAEDVEAHMPYRRDPAEDVEGHGLPINADEPVDEDVEAHTARANREPAEDVEAHGAKINHGAEDVEAHASKVRLGDPSEDVEAHVGKIKWNPDAAQPADEA